MEAIDTDETLFVEKPSQWVNIFWLTMAVGSFVTESVLVVIIAMSIWLWQYLVIECWHYRFGEKTITEKKGVLSHEIVEVHYSRIKSIKVEKPLLYRLVGLSRILIISSEPYKPELRLFALKDGEEYKRYIKGQVENWRNNTGVKETDFHSF